MKSVTLPPMPRPTDTRAPEERFGPFGLSKQESRVLALAMEGNIDKAIAEEMGISLGTVRVYWNRIRQKTGATRSTTIASLAQRDAQAHFASLGDGAEELRRELEARADVDRRARTFEAAFRTLQVPIALLDGSEGSVVWANGAFANLVDSTEQALVGQPIGDWMPVETTGSQKETLSVQFKGLGGPKASFAAAGETDSIFAIWAP